MITRATIQEMAGRIATLARPERIVLFGSHARGSATEESDVDLLVVARDPRPRPQRSAPLYSLLREYPWSKDILVYTPEELEEYRNLPASLIARALAEGVNLYEKQA